jgi:8-oxo-dGTP diphosphatase
MPYTYDYPRPALTVDAVIFNREENKLKVLLIKRKYPPFKDQWALPGGFVDIDETLEEAIHRELNEETGLKGLKLEQLYTFGALHRDPRGRTVSVVYYGFYDPNQDPKAGDDAKEVKWFDMIQLPELAFDHNIIVGMALNKIQSVS